MLKFGGLNFHMDIQVQYAIFKNRRYVADPGDVLDFSKPLHGGLSGLSEGMF
jgi:hypothetical protein